MATAAGAPAARPPRVFVPPAFSSSPALALLICKPAPCHRGRSGFGPQQGAAQNSAARHPPLLATDSAPGAAQRLRFFRGTLRLGFSLRARRGGHPAAPARPRPAPRQGLRPPPAPPPPPGEWELLPGARGSDDTRPPSSAGGLVAPVTKSARSAHARLLPRRCGAPPCRWRSRAGSPPAPAPLPAPGGGRLDWPRVAFTRAAAAGAAGPAR